ncbi:hypothetical protein GCM10010116_17470 [Microbispora rosea subsp. aerata]|nr:hypothetical protein GCM10010116_17470 [Microbispora rosea subsp. aerata]GIH55370.1 hypothetical protein Mro02_22840 [Microbispora rosea subsp. aerata]GLJ84567.1 hypothetical protein GCM10017588_32950 [Microbispora rosea subsp. aerata]
MPDEPCDAGAAAGNSAVAAGDGVTAPSDGAQAVAVPTATAQISAQTGLPARPPVGVEVGTGKGGRPCVDICLVTLCETVTCSGR